MKTFGELKTGDVLFFIIEGISIVHEAIVDKCSYSEQSNYTIISFKFKDLPDVERKISVSKTAIMYGDYGFREHYYCNRSDAEKDATTYNSFKKSNVSNDPDFIYKKEKDWKVEYTDSWEQIKEESKIKHNIPQNIIDIMVKPYHSHAEIEFEKNPESIVYTEDNVIRIVDGVIKHVMRQANEFYRTKT